MFDSKLNYGDGEVILTTPGDTMIIEINYIGNCSLHPNLGQDWIFKNNDRKIIIVGYRKRKLEKELIFTYRGEIRISSCKIINPNLDSVIIPVNMKNVHHWEKMDSNWETSDKYKDYTKTIEYKKPIKSKIKRKQIKKRLKFGI